MTAPGRYVDDERITAHLRMLLGGSEPGAMLHHLHVLAAPGDAVGPLGLPDPAAVVFKVYAISPDGGRGDDAEQAVRLAARQAVAAGQVVLFAGLSQEAWSVPVVDERARELVGVGRLSEHPDAAEVTIVYAVCRDGRRWAGRRWLTGPFGGEDGVLEVLAGRPVPGEGLAPGRLMRALVGIR